MRGSTASELSNGRPQPPRHAVRLTPTVAANSLNRTVFCFGYIIGASPLNPNAWTTDKLRAAITEVKTKYPEIAGVMMCKSHRVTVLTLAQISTLTRLASGADGHAPNSGFANATNHSTPATNKATIEMIRSANQLMLELFPGTPAWPD